MHAHTHTRTSTHALHFITHTHNVYTGTHTIHYNVHTTLCMHAHYTHRHRHTTHIPHEDDRPVVAHKVVHHLVSHLSLLVDRSHVHEALTTKTQEHEIRNSLRQVIKVFAIKKIMLKCSWKKVTSVLFYSGAC